jgi:hypothetical protein
MMSKEGDATMGKRFWVIGGEFRTVRFDELVDGTERLYGPFADRGEAEQTWRDVSERHRAQCNVRFAIVEEGRLAAAGAR